MHYACQELVFRNMKNVASVQMTPYSVTEGGRGLNTQDQLYLHTYSQTCLKGSPKGRTKLAA